MAFRKARVTPGKGETAEDSGSFAKIKGIVAVSFSRATMTKSENQIWTKAEVKQMKTEFSISFSFPKSTKSLRIRK